MQVTISSLRAAITLYADMHLSVEVCSKALHV